MSIFGDCASMIKAGFSASEIREMLKMEKAEAEENIQKIQEEQTKVFKKESVKDKDPEPDYKALYEKTKKDLDELQSENTKKDIKPASVDRDELFKNIKASIS